MALVREASPSVASLARVSVPRLGTTPESARDFHALSLRLLQRAEKAPAGEQAGAMRGGAASSVASGTARRRGLRARAAFVPIARPTDWLRRRGTVRAPILRSGQEIAECLGCTRIEGADGDVFLREVTVPLPLVQWSGSSLLHSEATGTRGSMDPGGAPPGSATPIAPQGLPALRALPRIFLLDIETAGLANAPILLVGSALAVGSDLVIRQYIAADYPAEALLLAHVARDVASNPVVATFNGTTFDLPALACRSVLFGVLPSAPRHHVDLLHLARRRWRSMLEDCRLLTLERSVLGRWRTNDLPSRYVPAAFHRFLRFGEPADVAPIVHHNQEDLVSMAGLALALGLLARPGGDVGET